MRTVLQIIVMEVFVSQNVGSNVSVKRMFTVKIYSLSIYIYIFVLICFVSHCFSLVSVSFT